MEGEMTESAGGQVANIRWPHYAGILLVSMATLLLESALTRED